MKREGSLSKTNKTYSGEIKLRLSLTFPLGEQPGEVFLIALELPESVTGSDKIVKILLFDMLHWF